MNVVELQDFNHKCAGNTSGTGTEILYARKSDFDTIQKPSENPENPEDLVTIAVAHTFKAGKGFRKLLITDETGQVTSNAVGEKDGRSFEHTLNGFVPGNDARNTGLLSMMANCPYIFLVPELRDGAVVYRQLGSEFRGAYNIAENNYDTGVASADRRGTQFSFAAVGQPTHAPFYTAEATLAPEESGEGE